MKQFKTFYSPVLKGDGSGDVIEAGDTVDFVLVDGESIISLTVSDVEQDGKRIGWEITGEYPFPRSEDVRAVDGKHQKSYEDTNKHDDPYDADDNPRVPPLV